MTALQGKVFLRGHPGRASLSTLLDGESYMLWIPPSRLSSSSSLQHFLLLPFLSLPSILHLSPLFLLLLPSFFSPPSCSLPSSPSYSTLPCCPCVLFHFSSASLSLSHHGALPHLGIHLHLLHSFIDLTGSSECLHCARQGTSS